MKTDRPEHIKKKVLVLTTDAWLDRLHGASVLSLFESLSELGYSVKVLLPSYRDRVVEIGHLSIVGLGVKRYIPVVTLISLYARFLRSSIRDTMFSVMIVDYPMLPILIVVKLLRRIKGVMLVLSRPVGEEGILGKIRLLQFKLSLILAKHIVDAVTAISPLEAEEFSKLGRIPREMIAVVPSPISHFFTNHRPLTDKDKLRRKLGMNDLIGKTVLVYHGTLDKSRGITDVVNAFTATFKNESGIALLLVGDGSAKGSLEKQIRQNKIKNVVLSEVVPYSTMPEVIAACDLGVVILPDHPWWRHQCPTKLIEFLAMGRPVVVSDLPGIRWAAGDSSFITYVKSINAKELQKAITTALNKNYRADENTRTKYSQMFSSQNLASKLALIIDAKCR